MLFRLHNGSTVSVENHLLNLSEFLENELKNVQPLNLINEALKNSPYKRVKPFFMKAVEDLIPEGFHGDDMKHYELGNSESKIYQDLQQKFSNHPDQEALEGALEYLQTNIDEVFAKLIHHIKFLKDETMLLVVEFLNIRCSKRSEVDDMFNRLPFHMQGCPPGVDLKTMADPALHVYIDFIRKPNIHQLLDLAKAASLLGISSLAQLAACRIANFISELSEKQMRNKFEIPHKFNDPVMEILRGKLRQKAWDTRTEETSTASQEDMV